MGEPLSPDCVFDFPEDELEPHPAYNFFTPRPLPGYASNPNNKNELNEANVPLFRELGNVADEPMVGPITDEIDEPVDEAEEHVIAPVVGGGLGGERGVADGSRHTTSGGSDAAIERLRVIKDLSASVGNLEYEHGQLVKKVIQVRDVKVAADVSIGEIVPRRDEEIARLTQQVQALHAAVQQRDTQIQQLKTMVSETSSNESTLMQCIMGLDKRLAALERRLPGPQ
nr:hypothetical protein [Tanacetum cinerariifolium]